MDRETEPEPVWTRPEIESPCVRVCVLHADGDICLGCRRTRAEIAAWGRLDPAERRRIMAELPDRPLPRTRRGGAAGRRRGA